ncbi:MAG: hypothetical protein HC896_01505 [Bacteroidales bacterium]|nr:hypothetical protein [Bacteroidales bacterium]
MYDEPSARKLHSSGVPTLGGLAIFAGLIISLSLFFNFGFQEIKYIIAALTVIFFIGIKDDILVTAADKKLIGELFAVLVLAVLGDIRITSFHGFWAFMIYPILPVC